VSSSGITGYHDEAKISPPGVVTGRYGTLGAVFFVEEPFWPLNTTLYVSDFHGNDRRFVSYFLRCQGFESRDGAAAVPGINRNVLHRLPARRPPLATQRKIAAALSAYDDLIENNTRRTKLLEEMVMRMYRDWFIHFRYPGNEDVPLVDSEMGPLPKGWRVATPKDAVSFHIGGGWGVDQPNNTYPLPAKVVRGTDIPRVSLLDVSTCPLRYHKAANLKNRLLIAGDIILEVSGGSKGQPVGRSALVSRGLLAELAADSICASFCKLVRCDPTKLAPEIFNYRLRDAYESGEIGIYQTQSTGISNLRFEQLLERLPLVIPPKGLQSSFVEAIQPGLSQAGLLGIQVRNLRATRDLLLPRLISGTIDVTDLDIAMPADAA
jgi:type I restriction enzyme S subunit